jgi:2-dehydro-3-deoxy-D-arabinonate dehydratase
VRIRKDSSWSVPEPELTVLINSRADVVGYTVGNDMSARDIEGENPLYLPQAKIYDQSCALGPGVLVTDQDIPSETGINLEIFREGDTIFSGTSSVSNMKRSCRELIDYLFSECSFPGGCYLMTGTGIVPPAEFTLRSGDDIRISIDYVGTLVNRVI